MDVQKKWIALLTMAMLTMEASAASLIKNSDCLECHNDRTLTTTNAAHTVISLYVDEGVLNGSVHKTTACASCHSDLTVKHPDDNIPARPVDCGQCHNAQWTNYDAGIHASALLHGTPAGKHPAPDCIACHGAHNVLPSSSPASALYFTNLSKTCGQCHEEAARDVAASVHGKAVAKGNRDAATCIDCHSEHKIEKIGAGDSFQISRQICSKCHASERLNTKYNLPPNQVKTFFESYHGLAAQYGGTRAANCASCHGIHKILPSSDTNSTINKAHLGETCGKCHPGASAEFIEGKVHVDIASENGGGNTGERINWWVRKIYLGLIFFVVGLMAVHNMLIFGRKAAARARRQGRDVLRISTSQRIQHLTLALSFIILAWTGFALKFPDSWAAQLLGSNETFRSWTHRIAGVVLLLAGAYHIGYALGTREGRRLVKDIAPVPKDLRDLVANALYLTGLSKTKPAFGRFGYGEKMEYWAVVWGTIIMGVSGLMIWFKVGTTRFLPRWVVDVATTVHYYEAILACLAIVVWHFYHVIFDPDVYPLNRAVLDGRVSKEWLEEEHSLDASVHGDAPSGESEIHPEQKCK
jgi:formate dehydrogenase gamma subunit